MALKKQYSETSQKMPYTNYYLIKIPDLIRVSKSNENIFLFKKIFYSMVLMFSSLQDMGKGFNSKKSCHIFDYSKKSFCESP